MKRDAYTSKKERCTYVIGYVYMYSSYLNTNKTISHIIWMDDALIVLQGKGVKPGPGGLVV